MLSFFCLFADEMLKLCKLYTRFIFLYVEIFLTIIEKNFVFSLSIQILYVYLYIEIKHIIHV